MSIIPPFFRFAMERENIRKRREAGEPRPWTEDSILNQWYFTNVYREKDKTTEWFRENVRRDLQNSPEVIPATMLFRWFNRIDVGECLFCVPMWCDRANESQTIFQNYMETRNVEELYEDLCHLRPRGPYVNGAYIIKAHNGKSKLRGVVDAFHDACTLLLADYESWGALGEAMLDYGSIEWATRRLARLPYLGMFMAYEITCDLRHTLYLAGAKDLLLWANPGPGARRGLSRLRTGTPNDPPAPSECVVMMKKILSEAPEYGFNDWEMREVEHTLCEFDKYERIRHGGRGKRRY